MKNRGTLFVVSGPSGVGKGTLVKKLAERDDDIVISISATTRQPREFDVDGKDYFFLTREKFENMIADGELLEYTEYCSNYYGTPKPQVESWLNEGKTVILEIETDGAFKVKAKMPEAKLMFILPPSTEALLDRLNNADTGTRDNIEARLEQARLEIKLSEKYDYTVINDDLDRAVNEAYEIIKAQNK